MRKFSLVLAVLAVLAFGIAPTFAQDVVALAYGDVVEGVISDDAFEIFYTFDGAAGDIIVLDAFPTTTDSDMNGLSIKLRDSVGREIATSIDEYAIARLWTKLESDGTYTVVVTRSEYSDDNGDYVLRLIQPEVLSAEGVSGEINVTAPNAYYALETDAPFKVEISLVEAVQYVPTFLMYRVGLDQFELANATLYPSSENVTALFSATPIESSIYIVTARYGNVARVYDDIQGKYSIKLAE